MYALRDACDEIAAGSLYRHELEQEYGKQIFAHMDQHRAAENPDSLRLQSEESALIMQYRKLLAGDGRDYETLCQVFRKLIETRCELADSLGYDSYIDLGYRMQGRRDYGIREVAEFRDNIRKYVTPIVAEIKAGNFDWGHPPAIAADSRELVASIAEMFRDLSDETRSYFEEMTGRELYDLEPRENKRRNLFTCCMSPYVKLPFAIGNFTDDGMETGYAVYELHSKTMEHFMFPYLEIDEGSLII